MVQVKQLVDYWCQHADAEAAADAARIDLRRFCDAATSLDDELIVHAALPAVGGAAFLDELKRLERQLYRADKQSGRERTLRQRRADALVEMATRSRTTRRGGHRPRPLVSILCGEAKFAHLLELADGTVLTPSQVIPLLGDTEIERIVFDSPSRVIEVSRRRTFTGALRRAIEVRDRHCQHRCGCDDPASECDVDHIRPRSHGGDTSQDNGRLLCSGHNRDPQRRNATPRNMKPNKRRHNTGDGDDDDGDTGNGRPPPRGP